MTKNIQMVEVTYTRTGHKFRGPFDQVVANGTISAVWLHENGTATHIGNGNKLDPSPCATWKYVD